jgi:hypothetical protein
MANLLLRMLDKIGARVDAIADSTGRLELQTARRGGFARSGRAERGRVHCNSSEGGQFVTPDGMGRRG